ncbi:MAG: chorismate-binding protein [Nannocystaceae bacterium]
MRWSGARARRRGSSATPRRCKRCWTSQGRRRRRRRRGRCGRRRRCGIPSTTASRSARRRAIVAGDTYQVNLAQRFVARWLRPPAQLGPAVAAIYGALRSRAPAERGALVQLQDLWVVSNSPETLLDVDEDDAGLRHAVSRPIKGTRPREADAAADTAQCDALWRSEKDRAERVMIVDLVRNDLGRLAQPGTVRAPASPTPLSLPTVHTSSARSTRGCATASRWRSWSRRWCPAAA